MRARLLVLAVLTLPAGCIIDGPVLMRPDGGAPDASVVQAQDGGPPDAAVADAGSDAGTVAGAGVDAGASDAGAPDAGAPDAGWTLQDGGCVTLPPCAMCRGCCSNGVCLPGASTLACGANGNACSECSAGSYCLYGSCQPPLSGFVDLAVDPDIVVTDVDFDGGVTLTVSATLRNLGSQPSAKATWDLLVSRDSTLSLLSDEIVTEIHLPQGLQGYEARRVTARAYTRLMKIGNLGPTPSAFVLVSTTTTETNLFNNAVGESFTSACDVSNCSGCCTATGCVPATNLNAAACGLGGAACLACVGFCDAGTCQ